MNNIAFELFLDVVRWYTSEMHYSQQTKMFWKLGYRLFGGRFIHFMGGFKGESQLVEYCDLRGSLSPQEAEKNFVVPSVHYLRKYNPCQLNVDRDEEVTNGPGLLTDMIQSLAKSLNGRSCYLTFDGKK